MDENHSVGSRALSSAPDAPTPRKKRKYTRRKQTADAPAAAQTLDAPTAQDQKDFEGLTAATCCSACNPAGCTITGDVCGHPYKSGLQAAHRMRPQVIDRYERAKRFLKHQAIEAGKQ